VIRVEDVRVLVGDELEVPVVHVAQRGHVVGRRDVELDGVERERRGRAVGAVGLIRQCNLGLLVRARRPAHDGHQAVEDRLGQRRHVLRDLVLRRVVVDAKVLGLDRLPQELRIVGRVRAAGRDAEREDEERDEETEATRQAATV